MSSQPWVQNFTVTDDDIEYLTGLLLERERPLTTAELARELVEKHVEREAAAARERYQNVSVYNPAHQYEVGQKLVFPMMEYSMAEVTQKRTGENPDYGNFEVIAVSFDDDRPAREFAAALTMPHKLSQIEGDDELLLRSVSAISTDSVMSDPDAVAHMTTILAAQLRREKDLINLAGKWFPIELILEVNEGHLYLAEAILDMAGGGPMTAEQLLQEIGGLGDADLELQAFSLNDALNQDDRFDEVGPAGHVLWYLTRLEPKEVSETPSMLRYFEIDYDETSLSADMRALEAEIDDELSDVDEDTLDVTPDDEITITLIYPHRRVGTLPLNAKMLRIFPTARRTERIWVTLVDGQDGEEFQGWVVRGQRFVSGLMPFYEKHNLPVGTFLTVRATEDQGKIIVNFRGHRPRSEWIRILSVKNNQVSFENQKRSIGAEFDDLMILEASDTATADGLYNANQASRRTMGAILRFLVPELSRLMPQGTVHFKTLYSAVNVLRRCPPGPIFDALLNDADFEPVGNHYWKFNTGQST